MMDLTSLMRAVAIRVWPDLEKLPDTPRHAAITDIFCSLYGTPLLLLGLFWLVTVTDCSILLSQWPLLLFLVGVLLLFRRFSFFLFLEIVPGELSTWQMFPWSIPLWSGLLILGPTALWILLPLWLAAAKQVMNRKQTVSHRWSNYRNFVLTASEMQITALAAIFLYQRLGGEIPLSSLAFRRLLPAFAAGISWWLLSVIIWTPLWIYHFRNWATQGVPSTNIRRFWLLTMGWRLVVDPFALFAAGIYAHHGIGGYAFLLSGVFITVLLARSLSTAAEKSLFRSREVSALELMGRDILQASPDMEMLPEILKRHIWKMFPYSQVVIRIFPNRLLLKSTDLVPEPNPAMWTYLREHGKSIIVEPDQPVPWTGEVSTAAFIVVPIVHSESGKVIGGLSLQRGWGFENFRDLTPAIQALAAHVASALHSAELYKQSLDAHRMEQELLMAWEIQKNFLPDRVPHINGWQISATLRPARSTTGDFFDFIHLPDGRWGFLVADVAGKGMGAALFMSESRTLIRTFALHRPQHPDEVFRLVNQRLAIDTPANLFVTAFYGILDPENGEFRYCSAGHEPALICHQGKLRTLDSTGLPLGIFPDQRWEVGTQQLEMDDVLILYTDGITDARNKEGSFFEQEQLHQTVLAHVSRPAKTINEEVIATVETFGKEVEQTDDLTILVLKRTETAVLPAAGQQPAQTDRLPPGSTI